MWKTTMFDWLKKAKVPELDRLERLEKKIRDLAENQDAHERTMKTLKLEWEESYDKLQHLMARITKRQKAFAREQEASSTALDDSGEANGSQAKPIPSAQTGMHSKLMAMRGRHGLLPR